MRSVSAVAVVASLVAIAALSGCAKKESAASAASAPAAPTVKTDCDRALDNVARIVDSDPAIPAEARAIIQKDLSTDAGRKKALAGCQMEMPKSVMCMIAAKDMAGLAACAGHQPQPEGETPPQGEGPSRGGKPAEPTELEGK